MIRNLDYKVSCVITDNSFCTTYPPWYVSCSDILPGLMKKIYISISTLAVVLNILSILLQVLKSQIKETNFEINVYVLNFTDILCGTYLAIIWVSDALLKDIYQINEDLWKSHSLCFTGLCTIVWFTVSAQLILLYLSTSRLMGVMYPIKTKNRSWKSVFYHINIIQIFSFSTSLGVTFIFHLTEKQVPTTLCLPFVDPSGSSILTKVSSWVVITSQSISAIIIAILNAKLVKKVVKSKKSLKRGKHDVKFKMILHLIITTTSNIICWFPVNFLYLSAMFLPTYPFKLIILTIGVVMPVNSIINPCVLMVTNLSNLKKILLTGMK